LGFFLPLFWFSSKNFRIRNHRGKRQHGRDENGGPYTRGWLLVELMLTTVSGVPGKLPERESIRSTEPWFRFLTKSRNGVWCAVDGVLIASGFGRVGWSASMLSFFHLVLGFGVSYLICKRRGWGTSPLGVKCFWMDFV
jgi:hypothetical protein